MKLDVTPKLSAVVAEWADRQDPRSGAIINPEWGLDDPSHVGTVPFLVACARLGEFERAERASRYLLQYQRPSGLIDLRNCNFDSSPDTGFAVQLLCTLLERRDRLPATLAGPVETFVRRAVAGLVGGGFHTPNHRWVIASALAQAQAVVPGVDAQREIDAYRAEGPDADLEGAFLEHSSAIYDSVTVRSLLFLDEFAGWRAGRAAALANLDFNRYLLHGDGTIETGLSRRQDYGLRVVPLSLAACYAQAGQHAVAEWLWARARQPGLSELVWLAYAAEKYRPEGAVEVPDDYSRFFPINGLWRVRRGDWSVSVFRDSTRLLSAGELAAVKISQAYFGTGRFMADTMTVAGNTGLLRSEGRRFARRPGYDRPIGKPVPPERWEEVARQRPWREIPACASELVVREQAGELRLGYRTLAGLDRVPAQVALDFEPGGEWITEEGVTVPKPGTVLFLKEGYGRMRYGDRVWRVGPGAHAHAMWQMRDTEPAPQHVRILLTFVTPVRHEFTVGWVAENQ